MRDKAILLFCLMALMFSMPLLAAESPEPVHIDGSDTIIVGYFDCWLHADGKTWQDTDHDGDRDVPGDGKTKTANLVVTIP